MALHGKPAHAEDVTHRIYMASPANRLALRRTRSGGMTGLAAGQGRRILQFIPSFFFLSFL